MTTASNNYTHLLQEIEEHCKKCGRAPGSVELIAVTKNHLWEEIEPLYQAGCRVFGESRVQEALPKIENAPEDIEWHFIGRLQVNKVSKVVGKFTLIHSVDSEKLARKLDEVSKEKGCVTSILIQVNTSGEESKAGVSLEELEALIQVVKTMPNIEFKGFMTMAPLTENEAEIRETFRRVPRAEILSMGMSQDWKIALEEGATHLRIGRSLFSG